MKSMLAQLARSDSGQDMIEYAILAAFFGVAGYLVLPTILTAVGSTYTSWKNPATGVPSLWDTPLPGAGS